MVAQLNEFCLDFNTSNQMYNGNIADCKQGQGNAAVEFVCSNS